MHWQGLIAEWKLLPLDAAWEGLPLREQVLFRRGIHETAVRKRYFESGLNDLGDPALLPDIEKAVALLDRAIRQKHRVFIAGDYDVDGISSAVLLAIFLRQRGVPYRIRLPTREEGYGLSPAIVEEAIEAQAQLFISVDCGTKNAQEIGQLKAAGILTIVCDHHTVPLEPATWPPADAFVNPHRPDASGSYRELCAAGVVFKVLQAYLLSEGGGDLSFLEETTDIAGVAILADVVPLRDENRILSRLGLHKLQTNPILGYKVLLQAIGLEKYRLESRDVMFRIVPRLNAAGRLYKPDPALQLLLSSDATKVQKIVEELNRYNRERQDLQEKALREAQTILIDKYGSNVRDWPAALVVANAAWHKGVVGLVAAKLTELYERPSAVLTLGSGPDVWVGSARSVEEVLLHEIVEGDCRPYLVKGGGHAMAAGFSVRKTELKAFEEAFIAGVGRFLPERRRRVLPLDGMVLGGQMLEERLADFTRDFEPVGPSNPAPRYLLRSVRVTSLEGEKLMIHSVEGTSLRSFEGRITFSTYRWRQDWRNILKNIDSLVVTPFRLDAQKSVQLKVRDVITGSRLAGQ